MRLFISGASGALGWSLAREASAVHEVWGTYRHHAVEASGWEAVHLDLRDEAAVAQQLRIIRPDAIIHCAAMTDVDACEERPGDAWDQNAGCTSTLARSARDLGARLVYISTDFVFDGIRGGYLESDRADPVNVYGRTKLEGEWAVRRAAPDSLVIRTCIFGWKPVGPAGLPQRVLDALAEGRWASAHSDQFFSPILTDDLSAVLLELLPTGAAGTYHVAGPTRSSKLDFVRLLLRAVGEDPDRAIPTSMADARLAARRPRDASLVCTAVERLLGHPLPDLKSGIGRLVRGRPGVLV